MKILYKVQVSNTTHTENGWKWLLRNDACMNIAVGIISSLIDRDNSLKFLIVVPPLSNIFDIKKYSEFFDMKYLKNIEFYDIYQPIHPMHSRFHFNFNDFSCGEGYHPELPYTMLKDIEVMINDDNTLTKNWKVLFHYLGMNVPIISTNYFFDDPKAKKVPKEFSYFERQIETIDNSDLVAFQCEASKRDILRAYCDRFNLIESDRQNIYNDPRFSVWGVGCHAVEINKFKSIRNYDDRTIIYFGNRITESANRYTNWHKFASGIGKLSEIRQDFEAIMLNPTHKVSESQFNEIEERSKGFVRVIGNDEKFTREDYLKFINKSHISVNLFVNEVHGGVTSREAGLAGNYLVMPNVNQYSYLFNEEYPFYIKEDLSDMVDVISKAIDYEDDSLREDIRKRIYETDSYEYASDGILNDLIRLKTMKND